MERDTDSGQEGVAARRRAILRALAGAPVILTLSSGLARGASTGPSLGNTLKECSNIRGLPADKIPPQCRTN